MFHYLHSIAGFPRSRQIDKIIHCTLCWPTAGDPQGGVSDVQGAPIFLQLYCTTSRQEVSLKQPLRHSHGLILQVQPLGFRGLPELISGATLQDEPCLRRRSVSSVGPLCRSLRDRKYWKSICIRNDRRNRGFAKSSLLGLLAKASPNLLC